MTPLFTFDCHPPWLVARFATDQRMLSWSLNRPGFVDAQEVAWLQVSDADLPLEVDPLMLLEQRLVEHNLPGAVGLMTARAVTHHHFAKSGDGKCHAESLVTLGLSNGITLADIGHSGDPAARATVGTINTLVAVSQPLSQGAMLEALSVASMARTAALLADGGNVIGTGTDCIVIACPSTGEEQLFAGLHTNVGTHITASVFRAIREALRVWKL